jgi:hypothetical protein
LSKIEVDTVEPQSGTSLTLGASGDTITIPAGATFDSSAATNTLPSTVVTTTGTQTLSNKTIDATQLTGTVATSNLGTGTADATTFLRGDQTYAAAGGTNTPAFLAYLSANQSVSDATDTKCQFDTEVLDTDNCYDNSTNYRFTPTVAGKYFVYSQIACNATAANNFLLGTTTIKKNGSSIIYSQFDQRTTANGFSNTVQAAGIVDMNGSTDYLESFGYIDDSDTGSSPVLSGNGTAQYSNFGAYRIIE